jgi:uncharacterized protein (UPF0276 family)
MPAEEYHTRVGVLLNPSMNRFISHALHRLDYLAIIPDRGWIDHGKNSSPRFEIFSSEAALIDRIANERPIVLHGIGLSICSAEFFDQGYAQNLIGWAKRLDSPWISEHLSFSRIGTGHELNAAIMVPVPYDREVLDMLVPRVRFFIERLNCPFLLENNVYYVRYPDQELTEEQFLNELCYRSGCGVLLDLHNLYTNAVNHGFSAADYLDNLDLANVTEIHVAGGVPMMGFHTDSHTGRVLDAVWVLLERVVPLAKSLRGVTFEFHESSFGLLGESGILEQIDRARAIVGTHGTNSELVSDVTPNVSARRC